jgi:predicted small lipoprotein YifL
VTLSVKSAFLAPAAAVTAVLIAACGSQHPAAAPPAAVVTGTVSAGPVSPLARPGVPAAAIVRGATVEALRGSQVAATTRTDQAGRYQFELQPGTYLIRALSGKYLSKEKSQAVTLAHGQHVTVNLVFDTGIR